MSIKSYSDKVFFLKQFISFWNIENTPMVSEILTFLKEYNTKKYFDIEYCLFFKEKKIVNDIKFEIFSQDMWILIWLLQILSLDKNQINKYIKIGIKSVQLTLDSKWEILRYAFNFNKREDWNIIDYSIIRRNIPGTWEETRIYSHSFPSNYLQSINVGTVLWDIEIIDMFIIDKKFFDAQQKTLYFLLNPWKYLFWSIGEKLNLDFQWTEFLKHLSCHCICVLKSEHEIKKYQNFSIYLWTYWL